MSLVFEDFDMTVEGSDIFSLEIVTNYDKSNCFIRSKDASHMYRSVILSRNTRFKIMCEITFYPSSRTGRFIPRLIFRRIDKNGNDAEAKKVRIELSDSAVVSRFWGLIAFLDKFKDIVDRGDFEYSYSVVTNDINEMFKKLGGSDKVKFLVDAVNSNLLNSEEIDSVLCADRKRALNRFLYLLRNVLLTDGNYARDRYRSRYKIKGTGDEAIWHHLLKSNEWILGINADIRYIRQFIDEADLGIPDTSRKGSPIADILGVSNYVTLIELKTSDTPIFKSSKGEKARANTWEFSPDFIAGISQCLGQKSEFDKLYDSKVVVGQNGEIVSKDCTFNRDVKTVLIIGCRYREFPHDALIDHKTKSETFELFRRNSRNVDIITYDELFERAYYIVTGEKIADGWFHDDGFKVE